MRFEEVPAKGNEQKLTMKITISEGRRYKVNQVAFGPSKVFTSQELVPGLACTTETPTPPRRWPTT